MTNHATSSAAISGHASPALPSGSMLPAGSLRDENPGAGVAGTASPVAPGGDGIGALGPASDEGPRETGTDPPSTGAVAGGEAPAPVYTELEDWVTDYFLPMFRRTLGGEFRWCSHWWRHGEAISRLTALWHAWEVLRRQPGTGIATWYREHLDHQLPILLGARGPFYQCSETAHRESHEAAAAPAPGGWWDAADDSAGADHDGA
jgi:hypothetical protein